MTLNADRSYYLLREKMSLEIYIKKTVPLHFTIYNYLDL